MTFVELVRSHKVQKYIRIYLSPMFPLVLDNVQGGSNMTGTDLYVNKCKQSQSYLNHLVY